MDSTPRRSGTSHQAGSAPQPADAPNGPRLAELKVTELDLEGPDGAVLSFGPALPGGPPVRGGDVYTLVRLRGRPVATVVCRIPPGKDPADSVAATARAKLAGREPPAPPPPGDLPRTSVVVATRERADQLARALDSLLVQDHPDFEVVVVDNAPATSATQDLVERKYGECVRYVRESVPGLAIAHNRGIAVADGSVIAFTDDDVIADPHWLTALSAPFAADPGLGCATGLILPARLRTPAQILLESHGGFAKGFEPREYDPARPPADQPLFPFTAGSFGSGANMAFRADALRALGGFDPATGTGTPPEAATTCTPSSASSPPDTGCGTPPTRSSGTTTARPGRTLRTRRTATAPVSPPVSPPCSCVALAAALAAAEAAPRPGARPHDHRAPGGRRSRRARGARRPGLSLAAQAVAP